MGNKLRILRYIGFIPASFVGYALSTLSLMFVCKYIGSWWWIIDLSGGIDSVTTGVMNNNYISVTIIGLVKGVCGVSGGTLLGSLVYGSKKMLGVKIISIFTIFCNVLQCTAISLLGKQLSNDNIFNRRNCDSCIFLCLFISKRSKN